MVAHPALGIALRRGRTSDTKESAEFTHSNRFGQIEAVG
jgi:hypothetical protein